MEKDVKLITSGIVLIILGLVFRPLFVQLGQVRPFILSIMWFPWALVAIGGFAFVLGILKLFGVAGIRTRICTQNCTHRGKEVHTEPIAASGKARSRRPYSHDKAVLHNKVPQKENA